MLTVDRQIFISWFHCLLSISRCDYLSHVCSPQFRSILIPLCYDTWSSLAGQLQGAPDLIDLWSFCSRVIQGTHRCMYMSGQQDVWATATERFERHQSFGYTISNASRIQLLTNAQYIPPTPTRLNCRVESRRRYERTRRQSWLSLQFPVLLSYWRWWQVTT